MLKYYMANADKAGIGLECLPGVKQLLQELKVCTATGPIIVLADFTNNWCWQVIVSIQDLKFMWSQTQMHESKQY